MKVLVAQINTVVGDFEGNVSKVLEAWERARISGVDIVVFPELTLTGYPPMDLLERSAFIEANLRALDDVRRATAGRHGAVVIGFAEPNKSNRGKPLYNAAALLEDGRIAGIHRKVLLPTYDVFDESRYFEPGPTCETITAAGVSVAITICEDIWNDKAILKRPLYRRDPIRALAAQKPHILVNLSASPFVVGKIATRVELARRTARRLGCPLVYANLVGANDGIIFDGGSFVVTPRSGPIHLCKAFREELAAIEIANTISLSKLSYPMTAIESVIEALCLGVRDFCQKQGFRKVLVGLSGGIDSAVVATLACRALGRDAVIGVTMPSKYTSQGALTDARALAKNLGIRLFEVRIDPIVDAFVGALKPAFGEPPWGVTEENLQARARGTILMAFSNWLGALVLNTGNKSELAVGYCTLYGDMVGGLAVIGDLTKQMVYEVGKALNAENPVIPDGIFTRPPSAELKPNQKDEDTLPPYPILDAMVTQYIEQNFDARDLVRAGHDAAVVKWFLREVARSEFKRRQAPIALKISHRAFGVGRRFPIVHKFHDAPEEES